MKDLFNHYEELPQEVINVLDEFHLAENDYDTCMDLVEHLNSVGYTCEFDLAGICFNLQKNSIMTTTEQNKLIAEFMGLDVLYGTHVRHETVDSNKVTKILYNSSWDWLIPVLIKCYQTEVSNKSDWDMWLNDALLSVNITELYEKIIQFIIWYNKQNK